MATPDVPGVLKPPSEEYDASWIYANGPHELRRGPTYGKWLVFRFAMHGIATTSIALAGRYGATLMPLAR